MKNEDVIKVGFCAAYDWELLKNSLPPVYRFADVICISIDKNRKSWSGISYEIDNNAFYSWIETVDVDKKVILYEDDFSLPDLTSIQNDNRQRSLMAETLGENGWHIQIDVDEYFLDFEAFVIFLKSYNPRPKYQDKPINISCNLVPLFKKLDDGYLYVDFKGDKFETVAFATNRPTYENARKNGFFNVVSNSFVLHETWARGEAELWQKLSSWGHNSDFVNKESYFNLWRVLDGFNYKYIKDVHPLYPNNWPFLKYCKGRSIHELVENILKSESFDIPYYKRAIQNSRNLARLKSILK